MEGGRFGITAKEKDWEVEALKGSEADTEIVRD